MITGSIARFLIIRIANCSKSVMRLELCYTVMAWHSPSQDRSSSRVPLMARGFGVEKSLPGIRRELRSLGGQSALWLEPPTPPKGVPRRTAAGPRHHFSARAVAPKADDLPKIAEKADDLEAIKKAVEDAAAVSGALWFSYLFVLFYFAIAAGAVTHADLFFENPVKLPFLNIELPLLAFFFLAPILFLIVHAYTLVHLVMLTDKAKRYHEELHAQIGDGSIRDGLRRQLPSNIFVQFLAGPTD